MRERQIERALVQAVKARGGMCPKWVSPGLDGMPDRIILLPGGRIACAELKAPGRTLRPLQHRRKRQLEALGLRVYVLDSVEKIAPALTEIQGGGTDGIQAP